MRVKRGDSLGNRHVKLVEIHIVAAPRERPAGGGEDHTRDASDGAERLVSTGNPFGSGKRERASGHRQIDFSVIELARGVRKIGGDLNRCLLALRPSGY